MIQQEVFKGAPYKWTSDIWRSKLTSRLWHEWLATS